MAARVRIDRLLVERGLFESRAQAQAAIAAGRVTADAAIVTKPSQEVPAEAMLVAEAAHPYVSRGGVKLAAALDHFRCVPCGRICLDVGASTGGFSDVLIARGARPSLHAEPRLLSIEGTDIRALEAARLPEAPDFVTIDVSFISLKLVLPAALRLAQPAAQLLALIKPQFEAGRRHVKKGIVRDPAVHAAVCEDI